MRKLNQDGSLVVPLAVTVVVLFVTIAFGAWAFMGRQDYKNNVDDKVAAAVAVAKVEEGKKKDAEFAESSKSPYKTFISGSSATGNLSFQYPKTWSAYATTSTDNDTIFDSYFYPDVIPGLEKTSFPLRVAVINGEYKDTLAKYAEDIKSGDTSSVAYRPDKVQSALGVILTGKIDQDKSGVAVLLPLRDKTIKIWTENDSYANDFKTVILPSVNFAP